MVCAHDEIGGDHLAAVARQPLTHAIREKTDARQRRHREHQREQQHRQLAGAPVTRSHAPRLTHGLREAEPDRRVGMSCLECSGIGRLVGGSV